MSPSKYTPRGTGNFVNGVPSEPTFSGTLRQMFETMAGFSKRTVCESIGVHAWYSGREASWWIHYKGDDCAPVSFYVRFRHDRIILAQIIGKGKGTEYMQGRMPKIVSALQGLTAMVVLESVVFEPLLAWAIENEFVPSADSNRTVERLFPKAVAN